MVCVACRATEEARAAAAEAAEFKHHTALTKLSSSKLRHEAVAAVKLQLAESMFVDCERQLLETQCVPPT